LKAVAAIDTRRPAAPWVGTARLGDAATMIPPLCGDGMAMALRSAELCVPLADAVLRGELSVAAWQRGYTAVWQREFAPRLRTARLLEAALLQPRLAAVALRIGATLPALAQWFVHATRGRIQPIPGS
jgi:menaquinone-9 beta-reductase